MVSQTMVFTARRFLILAALQFVVIMRVITPHCVLPEKKSTHFKPDSTEVFRFKVLVTKQLVIISYVYRINSGSRKNCAGKAIR